MIRPSCKQIKPVLSILDKSQFGRLVRTIMRMRTPEEWVQPLTAEQQLVMYVYEWLAHLGFLEDDKIRWLLAQCNSSLLEFGHWLDHSFDNWPCVLNYMKTHTLCITERRYAIWHGTTRWADLHEEEYVSRLERPATTHIICDLFGLFYTKQDWLKRLGGQDADSRHQHHAQ